MTDLDLARELCEAYAASQEWDTASEAERSKWVLCARRARAVLVPTISKYHWRDNGEGRHALYENGVYRGSLYMGPSTCRWDREDLPLTTPDLEAAKTLVERSLETL